MTTPRLELGGEVRIEAAGEGKPPRVAILAYGGGPMRLDPFAHPIIVDGKGMQAKSPLPLVRGHDLERIVGHADSVSVDQLGRVHAHGTLSAVGSKDADEVLILAQRGFPWQASIGATVDRSEFVAPKKLARVNGRNWTGPLLVVRESTLKEISVVPLGADDSTSTAVVAGLNGIQNRPAGRGSDSKMDEAFLDYVEGLGFGANLTPEQETALRASYAAKQAADAKQAARSKPATAAEIQEILAKHAGSHTEAQVQAAVQLGVESGDSAERLEARAFVAGLRNGAPKTFIPSRPQTAYSDVLECSLLMDQGVNADFLAKQYSPQTVDQATHRNVRGLGLHSLCRMALQAAGISAGPGRLSESLLRQALELGIRAAVGPSTISVPGILSNAANKSMLAAFSTVQMTWPKWCRKSSVQDFKSASSYRLTQMGHIEEIPPGGELKHSTLGESSYSRQAAQYGKLIALDRTTIVNDDLGALASVPAGLARMSATTLERMAYAKLLENAGDFFGITNGNIESGAGSAIGNTGLTNAWKRMAELKDANNDPVLITPTTLLCPPKLWRAARALTTALEVNHTGDTDAVFPNSNPWRGLLEVVSSPYLSESTGLDGAEDDSWYLLAPPGDFAVMDVCFLDGREVPSVESFDMQVDRLGLILRVVYDFGISPLEPLGGVLSVGS